jgi:hypothetical protein
MHAHARRRLVVSDGKLSSACLGPRAGCFAYFDSRKSRRAASLWDNIFYLLPPKHISSLSLAFVWRADEMRSARVLFFVKSCRGHFLNDC